MMRAPPELLVHLNSSISALLAGAKICQIRSERKG